MSGSWVTAWSSPGPCCWHCYWCWGTSDSSETSSNQLSMVKNIYLDTKINLLWCQGAEIHLEVVLDPVVGIVVDVGVHVTVLKPVLINSAWSKTYILLVLSLYKRSYFPCRGLARCLYSALLQDQIQYRWSWLACCPSVRQFVHMQSVRP